MKKIWLYRDGVSFTDVNVGDLVAIGNISGQIPFFEGRPHYLKDKFVPINGFSMPENIAWVIENIEVFRAVGYEILDQRQEEA